MTVLTFPSLVMANGLIRGPQSGTLRLAPVTQSADSPFDGSTQTIAMPGARWHATMSWSPMPFDLWRKLDAFIASLNGRAGRFTYTHPMAGRRCATTPGSAGSPVVNGAGQTGIALVTGGWAHSVPVFAAGDFFSFADGSGRLRMHKVLADVSSDGSGAATLAIAPALRTSPADATPLTIDAPSPVWMLMSDDQGDMAMNSKDAQSRASASLEIIEALV